MHVQELSMSSDETLIQLSAGGDFTAFQNLVARYQSRVFGLAYRIVGRLEDAEDVSQLTFLSLIEHIQSFRGESSAATWILRIASNHALKVLRKKRGLPTVSFDDSGADEDR
jgi:RNA polymerase sigma-70 factor (ECF subfamily)